MKKNSILHLLSIALITLSVFISCNDIIDDLNNQSNEIEVAADVFYNDEGILNFSSQEQLDEYVEKINAIITTQTNIQEKSTTSLVSEIESVVPFEHFSLAKSYIKGYGEQKTLTEDDYEITEVINDNLIPNKALHYILDDDRRVIVAGKIHQITEAGKFIYSQDDKDIFELLYTGFIDQYLSYSKQIDAVTYEYNGITFIDLYGYLSRKDLTEENVLNVIGGNFDAVEKNTKQVVDNVSFKTYDDNTKNFGLRTVKQDFTGKLGFFNVRTAEFNSDWRVAVSFDEVSLPSNVLNYNNFKTKLQYRKVVKTCVRIFRKTRCKTLFSYWMKRTASEMAIGIDYLDAVTEYEDFGLTSSYYISSSDVIATWTKKVGQGVAHLAFKGVLSSNIVRDWADDFKGFGADVKFFGKSVKVGKEIWNGGTDALKDALIKRTDYFVRKHIGYSNTNEAPTLLVYTNPYELNKEYISLNGITRYKNVQEKKIKFPETSGGVAVNITFTNKTKVTPGNFTPNKFKITRGSVFGAVKYNGVWRGVRIKT